MKTDVTVKVKITDLDKPTRNHTYYSKKVLETAFNEPIFAEMNRTAHIPVTIPSCGCLTGNASAELNYPEMTISAKLIVDDHEKEILTDCGIIPGGWCTTCYDARENIYNIENLRLTHFELASATSMNCSMEIVDEA